MAAYQPIGTGYTPIGGQAFVSPKKKFPHLKGIERERALYNQEMNPRINTQGFGGLADMRAQNAIDLITNLPVSMGEFDKDQVMANLTRAGEFEAAGLFRNYQQRLPGSAEALMEFRNMRQAQQQFAQRPSATPQNPYPIPGKENKPLYVPSGQPQPPPNVPQLAGDVSAAVGRTAGGPASVQVPSSVGTTLSSAMPPTRPSGSGVNIDPSLWTPGNIARLNPTGRTPLPTNPNDMRGQARGYGLVSSTGGSSSIAPAGGKVAGWSPTYSGDRQAAKPSAALPQNPYQVAPVQPAPFDMAAAVARNRAALDAKYPTPQTQVSSGQDYVTARPQPQTPRLLAANPYGVVEKTPTELMDSAMLNAQGTRNLAAPPSAIRSPSYYTGTSPAQNAVPIRPFSDATPNVAGIAPYRNPVALAGLGLENAKQANFQNQVSQLNRSIGLNEADSLEFEGLSPPAQLARGAGSLINDAGTAVGNKLADAGQYVGEMVNPYLSGAWNATKNFFTGDQKKLAAAAALRKKYQ